MACGPAAPGHQMHRHQGRRQPAPRCQPAAAAAVCAVRPALPPPGQLRAEIVPHMQRLLQKHCQRNGGWQPGPLLQPAAAWAAPRRHRGAAWHSQPCARPACSSSGGGSSSAPLNSPSARIRQGRQRGATQVLRCSCQHIPMPISIPISMPLRRARQGVWGSQAQQGSSKGRLAPGRGDASHSSCAAQVPARHRMPQASGGVQSAIMLTMHACMHAGSAGKEEDACTQGGAMAAALQQAMRPAPLTATAGWARTGWQAASPPDQHCQPSRGLRSWATRRAGARQAGRWGR